MRASALNLGAFTGALWAIASLTETTVIASGLPVQQTTIQIPAAAVVLAACTRITVQPGGTTLMTVRGASSAHQFSVGDVSTVATTVDPGTNSCPVFTAVAEPISYTFDADPTNALGRIQTTIFYYAVTP